MLEEVAVFVVRAQPLEMGAGQGAGPGMGVGLRHDLQPSRRRTHENLPPPSPPAPLVAL